MIKQAKSVDPVGHSLISEMLENYGALPTLDIDKSGISTEDNQIIRSPPVHADLIGIDFNPQVPVPLLVDLEEYEPNPETTGSIKATPEDPFEDPFQNLITKADNNSPTEEVLRTNSTAVAEIIDFGDESEESFLEKDLLSEIETKDLHFNEQAVELLDDFEFLLETYAVAAAAKSADENFELYPGIVETVFEATIQKEVRAGNSVPDGCTSKFGSILAQTKSKDIFPDLIGSTPDANNNHAPKGTDTNNNEPSDTPFQEGDQVLTDNEDIPVFEPDEPDHQPEPEPAPLVMYTAIGAGVAGLAMFTHKVYGWLKML
ncbi:unnamed protein product [Allacma fusca]|uniref:Uncharacterized protein n=1 Tax=Allacma fusca TaxID=39272 RepID=A0A8J2P8D1_9HEXA|nr:unnamed protein product [Allacma fusca]